MNSKNMTKTTTKKKKVVPSLKNIIRKRYESGEDLIELALEYKINYGTLRNISSKEKWEKGKALAVARIKETFEAAEDILKKRNKIKQEYIKLTENLRKLALNKDEPKIKAQEEALYRRATAIETLYKMDKELHSIYTDKELLELQKEKLKYEVLKKKLELDETLGIITQVEDEDLE